MRQLNSPIKESPVLGVQVLRGVAACLVVVFHCASNLRNSNGFSRVYIPVFGNGGVDIFFLISGFVMMRTTWFKWNQPGSAASFVQKRLVRIVPLYWLLTFGKLIVVSLAPTLLRSPFPTLWNAVASFLFIPSYNGQGTVNPVISAGWTLSFEMGFYGLIALALFFRANPLWTVSPVLLSGAFLSILRKDDWGAPATLLSPLLVEFVAGMWIASKIKSVTSSRATYAASALGLCACLAFGLSDLLHPEPLSGTRVLIWGLPGSLLLISFIALENKIAFRRLNWALYLGDASYSIYLLHVIVLPLLLKLVRPLALGGLLWQLLALAATIFGCIIAGLLTYQFIERPMQKFIWATIKRRAALSNA